MPVMFQNFLSLTSWFTFFVFVESMGEHSLAISNIIRSIYVVMMVPIWGFASATNTLVSYIIGKGDTRNVISLIIKISTLCLLSVSVIVLINLIIPLKILSIYTDDIVLIYDTLPVSYVVSGAALVISVAMIFFNGVSGTGIPWQLY